jgi:hypothetical protein
MSAISAEDAQSDFEALAQAFAPSPAVITQAAPTPAVLSPAPIVSLTPSEIPLVYLVHGTYAKTSPWAIPDQSALAKKIKEGLAGSVAFDRLKWCARNRVHDRLEAAARLRTKITKELAHCDRPIFIVAHSHGGNVAVRALDGFTDELKCRIRLVLMATPFLNTLQRFDVRDIFKLLPTFVQHFLGPLCGFSAWLGLLVVIHLFQQKFVPPDDRIPMFGGTLSSGQLAIFLVLFFGPVAMIVWVGRIVTRYFDGLPSETPLLDSKEPEDLRRLVIAYSQDEAFQALSTVINLFSLVHQAFFLGVLGIAWLSSRTKLIDWFAAALWLAFIVISLITWLGIAGGILLAAISRVWPAVDITGLETLGSRIGREYLWPTLDTSMGIFVTLGVIIGAIVITLAMSFVIFGTLRIGVYYIIGVLDQLRSRRDFLNAVFGSVSISMMPKGLARTLMLDGRVLFNHVKIYDDPDAAQEIVGFIKRETAAILKARDR